MAPEQNSEEVKTQFAKKVNTTEFDHVLSRFFDLKTKKACACPLVPGLLGFKDVRVLLCEIADLPPGLFLEVGALGGRATMAMSLVNKGLVFLSVDRWRRGGLSLAGDADSGALGSWHSFNKVARQLEGRVIGIEGDSEHILSRLEAVKCVAALHDGAHDYRTVRTDLEWIWPMILPGGKLIAHDYHDEGTGVKQAVDEYFKRHSLEVADITYMEHGYFVAIKNKGEQR